MSVQLRNVCVCILYYCDSFLISVIPSKLLSFVILNSSCTLPYPKVEKIGLQSWPYLRVSLKSTLCPGLTWIIILHLSKPLELVTLLNCVENASSEIIFILLCWRSRSWKIKREFSLKKKLQFLNIAFLFATKAIAANGPFFSALTRHSW